MLQKLAGIGGTIALAGIVSSVLYLIDYELVVLMWIDNWGTTVGWAIRIGLIVVGGAVAAAGMVMGKNEDG